MIKIRIGTIFCLSILFLLAGCTGNIKQNEQPKQLSEVQKTPSFYLQVHIKGQYSPDTITLSFWKYFIRKDMGREDFTAVAKKGAFVFELPAVEHPGYFSLSIPGYPNTNKRFPLLHLYLLSPGDSILMTIEESDILFSGKGSEKYKTRYAMDQVANTLERPQYLNAVLPENQGARMEWLDSLYTVQSKVLETRKDRLTEESYYILQTDLIGKKEYEKYFYYWLNGRRADKIWQGRLLQLYKKKLKSKPTDITRPELILFSKYFTDFLVLKTRIDRLHGVLELVNNKLPLKEEYLMLKEEYSGLLREKLLTSYLVNKFAQAGDQEDLEYCFEDILTFLTTPYFRELVEKIYHNQKRGALAYNFSLPGTNGEIVQLSDFKGKLVFLDFWFTGCRACITYAKSLHAVHEAFKDNPEVIFMTISIDKDVEKWKSSVEGGQYASTEAVNLYTGGKGSNHPLIDHYGVKGYPHPIIIDREGKIYKSSGLRLPVNELITIVKNALKEGG